MEVHGFKWELIDGESALDQFGYAVSMNDAGSIAVGAINNDGNNSNSGHVRIYSWASASWGQVGADIDGEAEATIWIFVSLNAAGDKVVIGAANDAGSFNNGHVGVYSYDGTSWSQQGQDIDGVDADDQLGLCSEYKRGW